MLLLVLTATSGRWNAASTFSALCFVGRDSPSLRSARIVLIYIWNKNLLIRRSSKMHVVLVKMES